MGSSPLIYPILYRILSIYIFSKKNNTTTLIDPKILIKLNFLPIFYSFNYKILNEGLLIDFLQKKWISILSKKFIFKTFFYFNDKFLLEILIFFLIDLFIYSKNFFLIHDFSSISFFFNTFFFSLIISYIFYLI